MDSISAVPGLLAMVLGRLSDERLAGFVHGILPKEML
jgi:hypothetical protein